MSLADLGYNDDLEQYRKENALGSFEVGRVISEHKERYVVKTAAKEYQAEIIGNLRYAARQRSDFPAVGDWVAVAAYDDDKALIHAVFPRRSVIERQAVDRQGEKQIIAANIDCALIVQAVDQDFNINRIERYLTLCHASRIEAIVLLNKIDLIGEAELKGLVAQVKARSGEAPVLAISNETKQGIAELKKLILRGRTYCLLGSSGVGKSSLVNHLAGREIMQTGHISGSTHKGRHVTSHRELIVLDGGGVIIDNPGMREVGIADAPEGLETTFATILALAEHCKFKDCTHTVEAGCAVLEALHAGEIDEASYENYLKMKREQAHFEATVAEKRQKDKDFGKMIRQFKKIKKSDES